MGYLNYNLEKVASAVEGEMEKQALKIADIVRMGGKAAQSGKSLHFIKRLQQRNRALANSKNIISRNNQYYNAQAKLGEGAAFERAYGTMGPNSRELARLNGRRIPDNNAELTNWLAKAQSGPASSAGVSKVLQTRHAPMGGGDLSNVVSNLRNNGWLHLV